jgi:hypothetical protein
MIRKLAVFRDFGLSIMEVHVTTTSKHLDARVKWFVIRLYLPYWEEARQYWEQSCKDGFHDKCGFSEKDLLSIIDEYSE